MNFRQAKRTKAKLRIGLQGPSGSGKTYSALLLAYGITNNWNKIGVIDTENNSADLYAHLGTYNVLPLDAPFTPEKYIQAIETAEEAGIEVVIIDSISHEWEGTGGILDIHSNMVGNSFTNWGKLTPRHNAFVNKILQSPAHVICNIRAKQDYVLSDKNGKMVPEKVGMKGITRDGMDYELTLVFELDIKHNAVSTKDRTGLFMGKSEFKINPVIGKKLYDWCNMPISNEELKNKITNSNSLEELIGIYNSFPELRDGLKEEFILKRDLLKTKTI